MQPLTITARLSGFYFLSITRVEPLCPLFLYGRAEGGRVRACWSLGQSANPLSFYHPKLVRGNLVVELHF